MHARTNSVKEGRHFKIFSKLTFFDSHIAVSKAGFFSAILTHSERERETDARGKTD